jgi:hypothetical protein
MEDITHLREGSRAAVGGVRLMPVTRAGAGLSTATRRGSRRLWPLLPCRGIGATPGDCRTCLPRSRTPAPVFDVLFARPKWRLRSSWSASQSGSQRAQTLSHLRRRQADVVPVERYAGRHQATAGDWMELIWEQEVAGSNPVIQTGSSCFPNSDSITSKRSRGPFAPGWASADVAGRGPLPVHVGSHLLAIEPEFYSVGPGSRNSRY